MEGRSRDGAMGGRALEAVEEKQKVRSGVIMGKLKGFIRPEKMQCWRCFFFGSKKEFCSRLRILVKIKLVSHIS
jgi:hypothetical protein